MLGGDVVVNDVGIVRKVVHDPIWKPHDFIHEKPAVFKSAPDVKHQGPRVEDHQDPEKVAALAGSGKDFMHEYIQTHGPKIHKDQAPRVDDHQSSDKMKALQGSGTDFVHTQKVHKVQPGAVHGRFQDIVKESSPMATPAAQAHSTAAQQLPLATAPPTTAAAPASELTSLSVTKVEALFVQMGFDTAAAIAKQNNLTGERLSKFSDENLKLQLGLTPDQIKSFRQRAT